MGFLDNIRNLFAPEQQQFLSPAPSTTTAAPGSQGFFQAQKRAFVDQAPNVLGAQTGGAPSTGGGGQVPSTAGAQSSAAEGRDAQLGEIDAGSAEAQAAFDDLQSVLQGNVGGAISGLESGAAAATGQVKESEAEQLATAAQSKQESQAGTKASAAAEARQISELQQGLQARFGGTTGTGRFAGEILGAQGTSNLAKIRTAGQQALDRIDQARVNIQRTSQRLVNEISQGLKDDISSVRNRLKEDLANIAVQKGQLASEKSQLRAQVIGNFQSTIQGLQEEARNRQFQVSQKAAANAAQTNELAQQIQQQLLEGFQSTGELPTFQTSGGSDVEFTPNLKGFTTTLNQEEDEESFLPPVSG